MCVISRGYDNSLNENTHVRKEWIVFGSLGETAKFSYLTLELLAKLQLLCGESLHASLTSLFFYING